MLRRHRFLVSLALLLVASAAAFLITDQSQIALARSNLDEIPGRILDLEGRDDRFEESVYQCLNADYRLLREYRGEGNRAV